MKNINNLGALFKLLFSFHCKSFGSSDQLNLMHKAKKKERKGREKVSAGGHRQKYAGMRRRINFLERQREAAVDSDDRSQLVGVWEPQLQPETRQ